MAEKIREERLYEYSHQDSETEETMSDLLRALRRKKGFGLFFVQCNPVQAENAIKDICSRFSRKRVETFELSRQSETLYGELADCYQNEEFDIACITGVEQALLNYEDTQKLAGWNREEVYSYSWKDVPPLLSHLNRQREAFESSFPIALVFFVPGFVIDYFVQRAPDFFDWRSGFFKFFENFEELKKASQELIGNDYQEYVALTQQQRTERKLEIKDRIRQLQESDPEQASNLLREQGRLFESGGERIEALSCYDRALKLFSRNHRVLNSKGLLLMRLERYEEATTIYSAAVEIKPDYYQAWNNKGSVLGALGKHVEAVESYDYALKIKPEHHLVWNSRGSALHRLERYEEAIESYDRAIEIKSDYYQSLNSRGNAFYKLERYEEAIESYDRAIEIKPDYYQAWYRRGDTLECLEQYEKAIESCDRILEIKSDYYDAWYRRGNLLNRLERYEEALESYDRTIEINPDYHYAWVNRGNVLDNLERYEEAIENYDRAIEIKPDYHYAWNRKGYIFYQLNEFGKSYKCFSEIVKITPNDKEALNNQAYLSLAQSSYGLQHVYNKPLLIRQLHYWKSVGEVAEISLNKCSQALDCLNKATGTDPEFMLAWANKSFPAYSLEKYQEALESCNKALELDSDNKMNMNEVIYTNKGYALLALDHHSKALESFVAAIEIDPIFSEAWIGKGTTLQNLGCYPEALKSFNHSLSLGHPIAKTLLDQLQHNFPQSA